MMDFIGLDTVHRVEEHYVKERSLPAGHLDWLRDNFVASGKLGDKSGKGGLYPLPGPEIKEIEQDL